MKLFSVHHDFGRNGTNSKKGDRMLNIVLPMARRGTRFADAGYAVPKLLIPVHRLFDDYGCCRERATYGGIVR